MKKIVAIIALLCLLVLAWWLGRRFAPVNTNTITVTDTITNWQHDTVYRYDTRIVRLPIYDTTTITDSLWRVDSVLVEVPMYRYNFDTTLTDTHSVTRLQAVVSGYEVNIDTLTVTTTISPVIIKEKIPWSKRFRPSIGAGIGTNLKGEATVGVYIGIGYLF